jgi:uroporphyrin-III C-methyltransferase / precorrin-2 dehydrogenase / sirohydrochlorin ferrochelatase
MKQRWSSGPERRRAIDAALQPSGMLDPFVAGSADRVGDWLADKSESGSTAFHHFHISSDDPDDLTVGQARMLAQADTIYHQPAIAAAILNRARADAARIACDALPDGPFDGITVFLEHQ